MAPLVNPPQARTQRSASGADRGRRRRQKYRVGTIRTPHGDPTDSGQRERAVNEYRQAVQTNDNTFGALDEARRYLQKAYEREKPKNG